MNPTHAMDVIRLQREIDELKKQLSQSSNRIQYVPMPMPSRPPAACPRGLAILMLLAVGVVIFWPNLQSATDQLPVDVKKIPEVGPVFSDFHRNMKVLQDERQFRYSNCPGNPRLDTSHSAAMPTP